MFFFFFLELAYNICSVLTDILHSQWQNKLKRKMLLIALSNILLEHPYAYETTKQKNLICFLTSKLKIMQLQIAKQSIQKSVGINGIKLNFDCVNNE